MRRDPIPTGEVLLEDLGLTVTEFARGLGVYRGGKPGIIGAS